MAPIVESIEIARRPEDVFAYVTDPSRLPEWQESVVAVRRVGDAPLAVGLRVVVTRRVGRSERAVTMELAELARPSSWTVRGVDGPVRGLVKGTIVPLGDGARSRVTMTHDFEGRGIGKLLVPLVVRPQARAEIPRDQQVLKERLEAV